MFVWVAKSPGKQNCHIENKFFFIKSRCCIFLCKHKRMDIDNDQAGFGIAGTGGGEDVNTSSLIIQAIRDDLFGASSEDNSIRTIMDSRIPDETLVVLNESLQRLKTRIRRIDDVDTELVSLNSENFTTAIKDIFLYCENLIANLDAVTEAMGARLQVCENNRQPVQALLPASVPQSSNVDVVSVDRLANKILLLMEQQYDLQNQLTIAAKYSATLEEQIQTLTEQNNQLQTDNQQLLETTTHLQMQFSQTSENNVRLQAFVSSLQQDGQQCVQQLLSTNNQLQLEQRTFSQVLTAGKEQLRDLRSNNSSLQKTLKRLQTEINISKNKRQPPIPRLNDTTFQARLNKLDSAIAPASRKHIYRVQQFFPQIQTDANNQIWRAIYTMLSFILDMTDTNYSPQSVQKLLVLVEGGMRGYSDTAISDAMEHIESRISNGEYTFRDPLIHYNRVVNMNLQSLVNLNLSTLYRRQNELYGKLAANRVFSRHTPLPALNTYGADKNFSKSSIYVYDDQVLDAIQSAKK